MEIYLSCIAETGSTINTMISKQEFSENVLFHSLVGNKYTITDTNIYIFKIFNGLILLQVTSVKYPRIWAIHWCIKQNIPYLDIEVI